MPTTRKKVIKTVYKDEDDSEADDGAGDFSDSGSDAKISDHSSSDDDIDIEPGSSADEFEADLSSKKKVVKSKIPRSKPVKRPPKFAKQFIGKISKQAAPAGSDDEDDVVQTLFSVRDLTAEDKLLPSVLNLSESDSSDDESPKPVKKPHAVVLFNSSQNADSDSENEAKQEYKDVWSHIPDNSEEVAKKAFLELQQHHAKIEETKASLLNYSAKLNAQKNCDVKELLAQGEEVLPQVQPSPMPKKKSKRTKNDSDSDMEDWEEVEESKGIPQAGLQLVVGIPDAVCKKSKKLDIEMMMKRKINRVKKENQVYMHKVHVLCWLGHGNFVSRVINDQEILAAALSMVPSKTCYPGERVDMKYVEQITTWFKDKLTLKPDKHEDKFRPKAPPLKDIILTQIKQKVVTNKKYLVFIFVSMLRALGLQCRIMFNFVTLPIKPPSTELCSLSTKPKDDKSASTKKDTKKKEPTKAKDEKSASTKKDSKKKEPRKSTDKSQSKVSQLDGNYDEIDSDSHIIQLDGNDDQLTTKTRSIRSCRATKKPKATATEENEDVSPPKRARKSPSPRPKTVKSKPQQAEDSKMEVDALQPQKPKQNRKRNVDKSTSESNNKSAENVTPQKKETPTSRRLKTTNDKYKTEKDEGELSATAATVKRTRNTRNVNEISNSKTDQSSKTAVNNKTVPKIIITDENKVSSKYFEHGAPVSKLSLRRKRSETVVPSNSQTESKDTLKVIKSTKSRTRSAPGDAVERSKYFTNNKAQTSDTKKNKVAKLSKEEAVREDAQRVSHRDLLAKNNRKAKNDVKEDLIGIIKNRVKEEVQNSKRGKVKGKLKEESDEDSDYLPVESPKRRNSDDDFKPTKITPKSSTSRKIDRRVLSSDDDAPKNKSDVWCEVYVEELEQWVCIDVVRGKVHCTNEIYSRATHPVCYIVGWDNNNYLKDLTRRYVPHWNTVTRKQRAEPAWWDTAVRPWLGPNSARDKEEDDQLNRMLLDAPLPKSIAEYKNHPLYALKRHLLKFEVIYPPDAATLGFVRNEPVYARECVYVCRSRDTWLKEAKVVRLGEEPYKIVKARPKWDRLSNKLITDKPLEVFGPWQVQDYEPPVAENGRVPRNAYGNVELFKECMLPKGTVHIKLPGLNRVAKKLNIDCAPAMTGFDFNGGWSHPVYDGFVVCSEYEEIITEAWVKDQEEQERREREKIELRVYGNWKRLIKGLFIRERLKDKYGFEEPPKPQEKKSKGPRFATKRT